MSINLQCTLRELSALPNVRWLDNFSKMFRKQIPDSAHVYNSCLWTGTAIFICEDISISTDLILRPDGSILPGMPDDITEFRDAVVEAVTYIIDNSRSYYDQSLVLKYDVRNIPPKVDTKRHPHLHSVIEHKKNTLRNVHPIELTNANIGSNDGLISLMKEMMVNDGMLNGTCTKYVMLNFDENIYWRALKVHITCN